MNSKVDPGCESFGDEQDKIRINDLLVRTIIGTEDYEREKRQELSLDLTLFTDLKKAGETDDLKYTVDYSDLEKNIVDLVEGSTFQLIESLAEEISRLALDYERVKSVKVSVRKTGASNFASSAEVEIIRQGN